MRLFQAPLETFLDSPFFAASLSVHGLHFTVYAASNLHILALYVGQRKRDDNKNKICVFQGGGQGGEEGKIVQNAVFRGKRHDNKILKVNILLSRNFVFMAQAPSGG